MATEKIQLKDMLRTGQKETTLDEDYGYEDLPTTGPVHVQAHVQLMETGVNVIGKFQAVIEEPCDRCYEPFEREIKRSFEDRFVYDTFVDTTHSGEIELHSEDFYDTIGPDMVVDIKDLVYQHIILATSTDRVCGSDSCVLLA